MERLIAVAPLQCRHEKFKQHFIGRESIQLTATDELTKAGARSLDRRVRAPASAPKKRMSTGTLETTHKFVDEIRPWSNDQLTATFFVKLRHPKFFCWRNE
jgi:hypothetical protein